MRTLDVGGVVFGVVDHGCGAADYFPGCGTHGTKFEFVATGIGDTFREALRDAMEQVSGPAGSEADMLPSVAVIVDALGLSVEEADAPHGNPDNPEWHRYVSVLWGHPDSACVIDACASHGKDGA